MSVEAGPIDSFMLVAELLNAVESTAMVSALPDPVLISTGPDGCYLVAVVWRGRTGWHAAHYVMGHHVQSVAGALPLVISVVAQWVDAVEWQQ